MMERAMQYTVRAGRLGRDGYAAAILFPTRFGAVTFSAEVPDGAISHLRDGMRAALRREMRASTRQLAAEAGIEGVLDSVAPLLTTAASALPIPGAGLLAQALPGVLGALGGALGGPPPPRFDPSRPASLPPGGSPQNLSRILAHVGVTNGMSAREALSRLTEGAAQRWNLTDHDDALHLLQALPREGAVDVQQLVAAATPGAPRTAPALPAAAASLAQMPAGAVAPLQLSGQLAPAAALAGAVRAVAQTPSLFGAAAPDLAALAASILRAGDVVSGAELGMAVPRGQLARLHRAAALDPRALEALRAAQELHRAWHEAS